MVRVNGEAASKPPLTIDVVGDPVCPWCYVGFHALAWPLMALSFEHALTVRYRPYRLRPDTPPGGLDRREAIEAKFPDAAERDRMSAALAEAARDAGVTLDASKPERLPDTTDAHRVVRWAHEDGLQREVLGAIYEAYWTHGEDVGEADVLVQAASSAGMNAEALRDRLAGQEDRTDVAEEAQAFRQGGVTGVPTFIVNERAGFAGALPKEQLLEAFRQLAAETGEAETEPPA